MAVADEAAPGAQGAVVGDEYGEFRVGAFDHAYMPEISEQCGASGDIANERLQRAWRLVLDAPGQEGCELLARASALSR